MLEVIGRVLADDVDDARARLLRVVQIGEPVAEPGAEMKQRARGLAGHAVIAVGGAGDDAFEQAQHATHAFDFVESGDEMHFGSAGIGEADVDAVHDQRAHEAFCAVHWFFSRFAK